jgi:hypothetical protein
MSIILDFGFAMFDRGRKGKGLTQGRKGAEPPRDFCRTDFGPRSVTRRRIASDALGLCASVASRLGVEIQGVFSLAAGQAAKFAGLGFEQSWQYVAPTGGLGDNIWHGVSDIVSYCQINSPIVTYVQILRRKNFASHGHPKENPGAVPRGQIKSEILWELTALTATPNPLRDGCRRLDTLVTHVFLAAQRGRILRFEVLALNLE